MSSSSKKKSSTNRSFRIPGTKSLTKRGNIQEELMNCFERKDFCDCVIVAEGQEIPAHLVVLAAASEVFAAMFKNDFVERNSKRVHIPDFTFETIKTLVRFLYNRKVPDYYGMSLEDVCELLSAAHQYDVTGLVTSIELYLCSKISLTNALNLLSLGDMYQMKKLKVKVGQFICRNSSFFTYSKKFEVLHDNPKLMAELLVMFSSKLANNSRSYEEIVVLEQMKKL